MANCHFSDPTLPPEVTTQSRDVNKHGGGIIDIWTGSDVTCKQIWPTNCPRRSRGVKKYGG